MSSAKNSGRISLGEAAKRVAIGVLLLVLWLLPAAGFASQTRTLALLAGAALFGAFLWRDLVWLRRRPRDQPWPWATLGRAALAFVITIGLVRTAMA